MRRLAMAFTGVALVAGLWPSGAAAHDHRPPRMNILTGSDRARASRGGYEWAEKQGRFCSSVIADAVFVSYPDALSYEMGDRIRFRFRKHQRPRFVKIRQYREVNRWGKPKGDGRRKYAELAKVTVNGNVRWEARFDLNRPGHHYFHIDAGWRDVDGCGSQSAEWIAHIRAHRS